MITTRLLFVLSLALALFCGVAVAAPDAVTPPEAAGITLDGLPQEAAWQKALRLPIAPLEVPTPDGMQKLTPDVRVLTADGRLVLAVTCAEDPGTSLGVHLLCAPATAKSAGDAVSIDFRPVEVRAPKFRAIGPRGVGRAHYRVEGAADITREGTWTLELGIPWTDLVKDKADALRLAVVVYTRTPNVVATWPAGAAWKGPAAWAVVEPGAGGWPLDVTVDAKRLAREDLADAKRRAAWLEYQQGAAIPLSPIAPRDEILAQFEKRIINPLLGVLSYRSDLAVPVGCLLGDAYHRIGDWKRAGDAFAGAIRAAPGWREAQYGLHIKVLGQRYAEGEPGAASPYAEALGRIADAATTRDPSRWEREGVRLGRALLQYKRGDFDAAVPVLKELAKRYPFDAFLDAHARFAEAGRRAARMRATRAKRDAQRVRPKADVETTRGRFTIELFPDEADNTVKNFVFLAQRKFYDGLAFHRTVPFFLAQTGDPNSREGAQSPGDVGTGTAGYAIRSEPTKLSMLRGAVVMASAGKDSEGSQFYVLTGSAMHLQGGQTVFGVVTKGLDVVDKLVKGDRIVGITLRDLDPKARYIPITVAGREPKLR